VQQCLQTTAPDAYLDLIEYGCTHELAYDPQCEGGREDWMAEIADLAGGLSRFRDAIVAALASTTDFYDARLLFRLAGRLAAAGDDDARRVMYEAFQRGAERSNHFPGAEAIVKLDGKEGLRFVSQVCGRKCKTDSVFWQCDVRSFTDDRFKEGDVEQTIREMSKVDSDIRAYLKRLTETDQRSKARFRNRSLAELQRMTFQEVTASDTGFFCFAGGPMLRPMRR